MSNIQLSVYLFIHEFNWYMLRLFCAWCLLSLGATEIRLGQLLPGLLRVEWIKQMVVVKDLQEWWVLGRRDTEDMLGNSGVGGRGWVCLSEQKCPKTSRWSWDMKEEEEPVAGRGGASGRKHRACFWKVMGKSRDTAVPGEGCSCWERNYLLKVLLQWLFVLRETKQSNWYQTV